MKRVTTGLRRCRHAFLGALACALLPVQALADNVQAVFDRAGLGVQVDAIGPQIRDAFDAVWLDIGHGDDDPMADTVRETIDTAFSADAARDAMLDALTTELTSRERDEVLQWFESEVGKRILRAEQLAVHSDITAFEDYLDGEGSTPLDAEREAVFYQLDGALGSTLGAARLLMQFDLAVAIAQQAAYADAYDPADSALPFALPSVDEYAAAVTSHVLAHHQFAFRDISTLDLKRYIAFASSASGARYAAAVQQGLEQAINGGTWTLITRLLERERPAGQLMTRLTL